MAPLSDAAAPDQPSGPTQRAPGCPSPSLLPCVAVLLLASGCMSSNETRYFTGGTASITVTDSDTLPTTPLAAPAPTSANPELGPCEIRSPAPTAAMLSRHSFTEWTPAPESSSIIHLDLCWADLQGWPGYRAALSFRDEAYGFPDVDPDDPAILNERLQLTFRTPSEQRVSLQFAAPTTLHDADPRGTTEGLEGHYFPVGCEDESCAEPVTMSLDLNFADFTVLTH